MGITFDNKGRPRIEAALLSYHALCSTLHFALYLSIQHLQMKK